MKRAPVGQMAIAPGVSGATARASSNGRCANAQATPTWLGQSRNSSAPRGALDQHGNQARHGAQRARLRESGSPRQVAVRHRERDGVDHRPKCDDGWVSAAFRSKQAGGERRDRHVDRDNGRPPRCRQQERDVRPGAAEGSVKRAPPTGLNGTTHLLDAAEAFFDQRAQL